MKYIYHHLGLGDHIICNGLVRHYKEIHGQVGVFCKNSNYEVVRYMYRDDENIQVYGIIDDSDIENCIAANGIENYVVRVGFENLYKCNAKTFDVSFYEGCKIPFLVRFTDFHIDRDLDLERKILDELNPNREKYIFTHNVNKDKIKSNFKIIDNPENFNIFNLISLIENAEEVHVMESSIKNLINSYKMSKPKFFYHKYVRQYGTYYNTIGLNKFEIVN
jgi:hypothetical protein